VTPAAAPPILATLIAVAEEAGALALAHRDAGLSVTYKDAGLGQALTQADLAVSRLLHARFAPRLIEEETAGTIGHAAARALLAGDDWSIVADPIDGTRPYSGGLPSWGTMLAACQGGWPRASVMSLPAWADDRGDPFRRRPAAQERGLLLAAAEGRAWWAPTRAGHLAGKLRPIERPDEPTHHVGWLAVSAQRYTLDYDRGLFPWCESSAVADAALVALGRLDATFANHMVWDVAPVLPVLEALGFGLYRWPDLAGPPAEILDLFDEGFSGHDRLWMLCRGRDAAAQLAGAVRPAGGR
jgi:myo-inositol-1(or 4)-monophosphatase